MERCRRNRPGFNRSLALIWLLDYPENLKSVIFYTKSLRNYLKSSTVKLNMLVLPISSNFTQNTNSYATVTENPNICIENMCFIKLMVSKIGRDNDVCINGASPAFRYDP
jgi:hypothetical protein